MLYNLSLAAGECTPHTTYWRPNGYEHGSRRVSTTQSHGMHDRLRFNANELGKCRGATPPTTNWDRHLRQAPLEHTGI